LSRHHVLVDCWNKIIAFKPNEDTNLLFMKIKYHLHLVFSRPSREGWYEKDGTEGYAWVLAYVHDVNIEVPMMDQ